MPNDCDCPRCRIATIMGITHGDNTDVMMAMLLSAAWVNAQLAAGAAEATTVNLDQVAEVYTAALGMWDMLQDLENEPT